jgi:hypothetical protein
MSPVSIAAAPRGRPDNRTDTSTGSRKSAAGHITNN